MSKNILKENMRRFRTKNLNEVNIKQIAQKKGVDLNILKQNRPSKGQAGTGNNIYKAVMKSIQEALYRQGFGPLDYADDLGYISLYPRPKYSRPTEDDFENSKLFCMVQPGNYAVWVDGMAEFKILPLIRDGSNHVKKGNLLVDDLIEDPDKTPKQNSEFEKALIEMKSKYGESN